MPREIWNEGRVVGLSAYEIYVKQHLSESPDTAPASEREWLASSLTSGISMLLKVPNVNQGPTDHTFIDIYLPTNSRLAAANTIVAQFFDGEAEFDNSDWAIRVTDYGQLISNTAQLSPSGEVGSTGTVPTQTLADWTDNKKNQLKEYLRIYDGLVIQPGNWVESDVKPPEKDFQANLGSVYPRIRLHVRGKITTNPLILLTGFTIKSVLLGITGQDTSTETNAPEDGDFLGPAAFPWAAKIVFVVPNSYITYFEAGDYERTIETPTALDAGSQQETKLVQDTPVIDMQASKPETFYGDGWLTRISAFTDTTSYTAADNPRYQYTVDQFSTLGDAPDDGEAVLTVYQKKDIYPPALYGTFVNSADDHYLNPLDVVAPGTVKMFYESDVSDLIDYENTFPGTTSMNKNSDGTIQVLNDNDELVDVAGLEINYLSNNGDNFESPTTVMTGDNRPRVIRIKTGQKSAWGLMMSTDIADGTNVSPTQVTISKKPTSVIALTANNSDNNIAWSALLDALRNNKAIDLLGTRLKDTKASLIRTHTSSTGPYIIFGPNTGSGSNKGLRLYISDTVPETAGVPEGSIGIGWGLDY